MGYEEYDNLAGGHGTYQPFSCSSNDSELSVLAKGEFVKPRKTVFGRANGELQTFDQCIILAGLFLSVVRIVLHYASMQ